MPNPEFSVIVPVYNSGSFVKRLMEDLSQVFLALNKSYEMVLVNDFSSDNSLRLMTACKMEKSLPVNIIDLKKNVGQYAATLVGLHFAKGNYLITIDADFCPPPFHIKTLIENKFPQDELVYGEMKDVHSSFLRKAGSVLFNGLIRVAVNKNVGGKGSSFRLINQSLARQVLQSIHDPLLLDIKLIDASAGIRFVPISITRTCQSSYSTTKLIQGGFGLIKGILFERLHLKRVFIPDNLITAHH